MAAKFSQDQYHWINKAVNSLDPETDYELMWRLMSCYRLSDFMNNLTYSLTFPNFVVTSHGAEAVWRSDGGKVVQKGTQRVEDTENYNMTWWYYGPSDQRCKDAVQRINNLHTSLARKYPGNFSHNEDYIYTLAFSAILMHRLRLLLGLSGFSNKEKTAAHHFWRDMTPLFTIEGGTPVGGYPADFDGCMKFCEEYEKIPREFDERARNVGLAIFNQFAFRYFPPGFRWLGVSFPLALSLPTTLSSMRLKPVNPILGGFIIFVVRTLMWFSEVFLPDPKVSFFTGLESLDGNGKRMRKENIRGLDVAYSKYIKTEFSGPGCPFHTKIE